MKRYRPNLLLMVLDACLVTLSFYFAYWVRFEGSIPARYLEEFRDLLPLQIVCTLAPCFFMRSYSKLWLYADPTDRIAHIVGCFIGFGLVMLTVYLLGMPVRSNKIFLLAFLCIAGTTSMVRFMYRYMLLAGKKQKHRNARRSARGGEARRLLIYGAGIAGAALIDSIRLSPDTADRIVCLIDDDPSKVGRSVRGVPVLGTGAQLLDIVARKAIDTIIIAIPTATGEQMRSILTLCKSTGCEMRRLLSVEETVDCRVENVRPVDVSDLLGREPVRLDNSEVASILRGRVVLVTGGGGSIGSELCRQIMHYHPARLVVFDIYENNAFAIEQELLENPENAERLRVYIGSVQDVKRLREVFELEHPAVVFHAAAHKHVPLMEHSPCEAVKNNVFGTHNLARVSNEFGVERFVMISTDKAVNPTNIMGTTKYLCEQVLQGLREKGSTEFAAVRFGNVLGSNGSVIPLFQKQIAYGGPVTITDKRIVRYFMTIPEAVSLVLEAGSFARSGEVFVLDMGQPVHILELAENLIRLSGYTPYVDIKIEEVGLRPGEKLYEELLTKNADLHRTENEKIFVEERKPLPYAQLSSWLSTLSDTVQQGKREDIFEVLHQLVPTFREPEEVNRQALEEAERRKREEAGETKEDDYSAMGA